MSDRVQEEVVRVAKNLLVDYHLPLEPVHKLRFSEPSGLTPAIRKILQDEGALIINNSASDPKEGTIQFNLAALESLAGKTRAECVHEAAAARGA